MVKDDAVKGASESSGVEGVHIQVEAAPGEKCERCWIHDGSVGENEDHKTICSRCVDALKESGIGD